MFNETKKAVVEDLALATWLKDFSQPRFVSSRNEKEQVHVTN